MKQNAVAVLLSLLFIGLAAIFLVPDSEITSQIIAESPASETSETFEEPPTIVDKLVEEGEIIVAGETLTLQEVESEYENVPEYAREDLPLNSFVQTHINKVLFLKEAENQAIEVSDLEVDEQIDQIITVSGVTAEEFEESLNGATIEQFKAAYKEQLIVAKLIESNLDVASVTVTDEELDAFVTDELDGIEEYMDQSQFDAVEIKLEERLKVMKQAELVTEYVNRLREAADIEPMQ